VEPACSGGRGSGAPPDEADTSRRTPLYVDHLGVDPDPHPLVSVPVAYFPPRVISAAGGQVIAWSLDWSLACPGKITP
jgi:hypothetical protein